VGGTSTVSPSSASVISIWQPRRLQSRRLVTPRVEQVLLEVTRPADGLE
jgi:hypothetical protein